MNMIWIKEQTSATSAQQSVPTETDFPELGSVGTTQERRSTSRQTQSLMIIGAMSNNSEFYSKLENEFTIVGTLSNLNAQAKVYKVQRNEETFALKCYCLVNARRYRSYCYNRFILLS